MTTAPFAIKLEHRDRVAIVTAVGELDWRTGRMVADGVRSALRRRPFTVVIDLSRVSFCDLSGLREVDLARRGANGVRDPLVVVVGSAATHRLCALLRTIARSSAPTLSVPLTAATAA